MTTTTILVQKDSKNLVPMQVTSAQRTVWAQNFTIYDINADGTKSAPFGPTVLSGGGSMARTQAQIDAGPTPADIAIFQGEFFLDTDPTKKYSVNTAGTAYVLKNSGGTGAVSSVAGRIGDITLSAADLTDDPRIEAALASIPQTALAVHAVPISGGSWDPAGNVPTITSGTAPTDGIVCRTCSGDGTTLVDGQSVWKTNDTITWNGTIWYRTATFPRASGTSALVTSSSTGQPGTLAGGSAAGPLMLDTSGVPTIGKVGTDVGAPIFYVCTQPFGIAPSGSTIGANGAAFTAGTAFIETYGPTGGIPYDGIWLYFPAAAIDTASLAGFYWVVMTSTTAGTIYQERIAAGSSALNTKSATATAFTTNAGSTNAGTTSQTLGLLVNLTADYLGANGTFEIEQNMRSNASAGSKTFQPKLGGSNFGAGAASTATSSTVDAVFRGYNANNKSRQRGVMKSTTGTPSLTIAPANGTINTVNATTIGLDLKLATATDWVVCHYCAIKIWPAA
jgi:hypothetical protein